MPRNPDSSKWPASRSIGLHTSQFVHTLCIPFKNHQWTLNSLLLLPCCCCFGSIQLTRTNPTHSHFSQPIKTSWWYSQKPNKKGAKQNQPNHHQIQIKQCTPSSVGLLSCCLCWYCCRKRLQGLPIYRYQSELPLSTMCSIRALTLNVIRDDSWFVSWWCLNIKGHFNHSQHPSIRPAIVLWSVVDLSVRTTVRKS